MQTSTHPRTTRPISRLLGGAVASLVLALGSLVALATPASAVTQAQAEAAFRSAGITWSSSGGCTDRSNPTCTSFDGLRQATVDGARTLRSASGCALNITGGTETGHAGGEKSHGTGYKLDFSLSSCLSGYIQNTFTYSGTRGDGAALYTSGSGNVYAKEGNHWDVLYNNCGGC